MSFKYHHNKCATRGLPTQDFQDLEIIPYTDYDTHIYQLHVCMRRLCDLPLRQADRCFKVKPWGQGPDLLHPVCFISESIGPCVTGTGPVEHTRVQSKSDYSWLQEVNLTREQSAGDLDEEAKCNTKWRSERLHCEEKYQEIYCSVDYTAYFKS